MDGYLQTELQKNIFYDRFAQRNLEDDTLLEHSAEDMFKRLAKEIIKANDETDTLTEKDVVNFLKKRHGLFAGRILANVGGVGTNMSGNCFTVPIEDSRQGIMKCQSDTMEIHAKGGGVGTNFSPLRPKGDVVKRVRGESSGPCSFLDGFDAYGITIKQGGSRRAARMTILNVDHPDIYEFIDAKRNQNRWTTTNISVGISDRFMEAVCNDDPWDLQFNGKVYKTVEAEELFHKICKNAHDNGEPGLLFLDTINNKYPLRYKYEISASNPCQPEDTLIWDVDRLRYITDQNADSWTSWYVGEKELLELTTNTGLKIRCTPEHKVILKNGSKCSAEECLGEELQQPNDWAYLSESQYVEWIPDEIVRGFLFGDGFICGGNQGVSVKLDREKEPEVAELLEWFGFHQQGCGSFYMNRVEVERKIDISFLAERVWEREIPEDVLTGKPHSFLRGLYAANGSCNKSHGQISLKTTSRKLAEQVQVLLGSLGIHASVTSNRPTEINWSNGTYESRHSYNIQTSTSYAIKFQEVIGFFAESKRKNIREAKRNGVKIVVTDIQSLGKEDVWDYRMKNPPHYNYCQGTLLGNCGERPQPDYSMCILGSLIVSSFVKKDKTFDWQKFEKAIKSLVQMLDNIIDISTFPIPEVEKMVKNTRPIGVGLMGFADALFKMEIPYGENPECTDFTEELGRVLEESAREASEEIATRKGTFPDYDADKADFPPRRNATLLSIAPTGTVASLAGVSYGIEPHFAPSVVRNDGLGRYVSGIAVLDAWLQERETPDTPHWARFVLTSNPSHRLTVVDHLAPLEILAQYVDAGISKTINLPKEATVEAVESLYLEMWQRGIKGGTVYRDGCRENQPLSSEDSEEDEYEYDDDDNDEIEFIDLIAQPREVPITRPAEVTTLKYNPNKPSLNIVITDDGEGPLEVFFSTKDAYAQEYLNGMAFPWTTLLRRGIDCVHLLEIYKQYESPSGGGWYKGRYVPSMLSGIAMVIEDYFYGAGYLDEPETKKEMEKITEKNGKIIGERCPNPKCGMHTLVPTEGCKKCLSCGYSECG